MRRTVLTAVGAAAAVTLAVAGCGSSSKSSSPQAGPSSDAGTSSAPASAAATSASTAAAACAKPDAAPTPATASATTGKATGTPIKLGAIGSYTGAQGDSIGAMDETIKAWASYTNDNGGINGHPVTVEVVDDKGDTGTAVTAANKMVSDGVVALVGSGSTIDDSWRQIMDEHNIPVIGSADYNPSYLADPCFFADGAQVPQQVYGALTAAKAAGVTKLGIFYCSGDAETPCSNFSKLFQGISAVTTKVPVVINQSIPDNSPTAAQCLAAKKAGADGMIVLENAALVAKFADTCAAQGYHPKQINVSGTNGKAWETSKNMEGAISAAANASRAGDNPEIKTMITALDKYAPGVVNGAQWNALDVSAWTGGQIFKKAAEAAGVGPDSTSTDVLAGLYSFKDETLNGLTVPLNYTPTAGAAPAFTTAYFLDTIKNGKFAAYGDGTAQQIPTADITAIVGVLHAAG